MNESNIKQKSNGLLNSICSTVNRNRISIFESKFNHMHKYFCHLINMISIVESIEVDILNID
jgi:hypothetical protein